LRTESCGAQEDTPEGDELRKADAKDARRGLLSRQLVSQARPRRGRSLQARQLGAARGAPGRTRNSGGASEGSGDEAITP